MVSEGGKGVHDRQHLLAKLSKTVLNAWRVLTIVAAKDEAVVLQLAETVGKHLLRDPVEVAA